MEASTTTMMSTKSEGQDCLGEAVGANEPWGYQVENAESEKTSWTMM